MSQIKRKGFVKLREAGVNYEINRKNLHYKDALEHIIQIYESENYRERTIKDYRKN
ncbi:hypothetical protein [Virgibacillus sp. YIM 98842]|uniref:hypothetical protein n=1 Tax=Virgibacillus sp. YIM 98842 TaxID=2663533 RepID=UPI0013DBEFB1|nr:hypothetical protein [Virgibacillus sp. YIM 98842]